MANLLERLLSSAILIGIVVITLFFLPLWCFSVVVGGFIAFCLYEFFTMARHRGILINRLLGIALGVFFTLLVAWKTVFHSTHPYASGQDLMVLTWDIFWPVTIVIIFLRQFTRQNTFEALSGLATTLFGLAYIPGLLSYLFYIRVFGDQGILLVFFLILVTKMGDAGAYAIGKMAGRHKLILRISPGKTVEGFVGGILVSAATASLSHSMVAVLRGSPVIGFTVGLLLGIFGQLGDLAESLIKRDCQVKDSGKLLPGLGGMLDVLDSLLFTSPIFYIILIYF
jgi:phosphatidate cytidylyltransferase